MVKFRLMGTKEDMENALEKLNNTQGISIDNVSESFANKGSDCFYRRYGEIRVNKHTGRRNTNEQGYPSKKRAVKEFMLDTNASKRDATAAVLEMFHRYENTGETVQPTHYTQKPKPVKTPTKESVYVSSAYDEKPRKTKSGMTAGKAAGLAIGATAYVGLGVIFELAKGYTKRK